MVLLEQNQMLGNIISAGASLIGGFMNKESAEDAETAKANLARDNYEHQKEFAQKGLTWKIADAMANKDLVHPIYSLGSAGSSFSPVSANFSADTSLGNSIASAGQDIGRAVNASSTQPQRLSAYQEAAQTISLEKGTLENELLKTQLASQQGRLRQTATPPFPTSQNGDQYLVPGQTESGPAFKDKPGDRIPAAPGAPWQEGGAISDMGFARTPTGYSPVPSKDVKERIEDMPIQELIWALRNNVAPNVGVRSPPPNSLLQKDQVWRWSYPKQEYYIANKPTRNSGW